MGAATLGLRSIIGTFVQALEADPGIPWVMSLSRLFRATQETEDYKWLGQAPAMREWVGGRHAKGFSENGISIKSRKFEATLEALRDELRRDKTGQLRLRIGELVGRTRSHWAALLSTLIEDGESKVCYDGQFFFDTDHTEGASGTQDNDITFNVTTPTAPTATEMRDAILKGVQQIHGFKDDQGEPMNEFARRFLVKVPTALWGATVAGVGNPFVGGGDSNTIAQLRQGGYEFNVVANPRLTWTDRFALFRIDGQMAPFIRQVEALEPEEGSSLVVDPMSDPITDASDELMIEALERGSDIAFKEDKYLYGVKALRNVGYGYWQHACLVTLT